MGCLKKLLSIQLCGDSCLWDLEDTLFDSCLSLSKHMGSIFELRGNTNSEDMDWE